MTYLSEDEVNALRRHAEEHWDAFRNNCLDTMSEDEFEELCRKLGLEPDE